MAKKHKHTPRSLQPVHVDVAYPDVVGDVFHVRENGENAYAMYVFLDVIGDPEEDLEIHVTFLLPDGSLLEGTEIKAEDGGLPIYNRTFEIRGFPPDDHGQGVLGVTVRNPSGDDHAKVCRRIRLQRYKRSAAEDAGGGYGGGPTVTICYPPANATVPASFLTYGTVDPTSATMVSYAMQGIMLINGKATTVQGYNWAFSYQLPNSGTWSLTVSASVSGDGSNSRTIPINV